MVLGPDCNQGDILRNQYHSGIIFAIIFLKFPAFSHLICSSHSLHDLSITRGMRIIIKETLTHFNISSGD